jgi:hypothetical protein
MTTDGYGGMIPAFDPLAGADWKRDSAEGVSACACGATEPARISADGCSECRDDWPRCAVCSAWVGDGTTWLPGFVWVLVDGEDARVCAGCWEGAA